MTSGDRIENLIYDWLERNYPDGPSCYDPAFHCDLDLAIEIKMIPVFDAIECNLSNGGWAQFSVELF